MAIPEPAPLSSPAVPRRRRPSTSGIAATVCDAAQGVESRAGRALLLLWDELPAWRRDNVFLRTGYRPDSNSYAVSISSLLYLHNESVNIWSHLTGAIVFLFTGLALRSAVAPRYASATSADALVFSCFFDGAVLCLGMSATYHTVSNHSPEVSRWGNKLDYTGITLMIVGSYIPALYYGFFCRPVLMTVYVYTVSEPRPAEDRPVINESDFAPGNGMHCCFLDGAFPNSGLATLPGPHVYRPRRLRRSPYSPRLGHIWL